MKKEYDCSDRRNKHHLDEVSKNTPSRLIAENCSADVERLNRPAIVADTGFVVAVTVV